LENSDSGDVRLKDGLSSFVDIHPFSLGTRKTLIYWIVSYMLTAGNGNAFVAVESNDNQVRGFLEDMIPLPGATAIQDDTHGYVVHHDGKTYIPGGKKQDVLHFVLRPDLLFPWRGRGVQIQLKDVLQNLRQSAATTNSFLTDKWKPSVIIKVDALADEVSTPEGRRKLLDSYVATQNAGEPWVVPADLMDVVTVKPLSLADLAISSNVELDKRAVAAAFGVPPFVLGVGGYNQDEYNNCIRRTVLPLADGIAQVLTKGILDSPSRFFRFNPRKLYAYNLEQLAGVGGAQRDRGVMSGNEVRDWLDLPPREGLDELKILENYIPIDRVGDQKKLQQEGS